MSLFIYTHSLGDFIPFFFFFTFIEFWLEGNKLHLFKEYNMTRGKAIGGGTSMKDKGEESRRWGSLHITLQV